MTLFTLPTEQPAVGMPTSCPCLGALMYTVITLSFAVGSWVNCEPQINRLRQSVGDKNKASGGLGPDLCSEKGCSEPTPDYCPSTLPEHRTESSEEEKNYEVSEVDDENSGLLSQLFSLGSNSVATVYRTAKENIYDNGARLVGDFAKKVREIVHEEFYSFLQTTLNSLGNALLTPGILLWYGCYGNLSPNHFPLLSLPMLLMFWLYFLSVRSHSVLPGTNCNDHHYCTHLPPTNILLLVLLLSSLYHCIQCICVPVAPSIWT